MVSLLNNHRSQNLQALRTLLCRDQLLLRRASLLPTKGPSRKRFIQHRKKWYSLYRLSQLPTHQKIKRPASRKRSPVLKGRCSKSDSFYLHLRLLSHLSVSTLFYPFLTVLFILSDLMTYLCSCDFHSYNSLDTVFHRVDYRDIYNVSKSFTFL